MTLEIDDSIESLFARKWSNWCFGRILRPAALDVAALGSGAVHCSHSYSLRNQGNVLGVGLNHLESPTNWRRIVTRLGGTYALISEAIENLIGEDNGPGASQLFETLWPGSWEKSSELKKGGAVWKANGNPKVVDWSSCSLRRALGRIPSCRTAREQPEHQSGTLWNHCLVGGFKHEFYFPFHIWDVILPIDELHHFSRWLLHHQPVVELCSKMSKMQKRRLVRSLFIKPCEVRLYWYYLVASFIIDLVGSWGLIFLWSDCLRYLSIIINYL